METYTSFSGFALSNLTFNVNVDTKSAVESVNAFFAAYDKAAQDSERKTREAFEKPLTKEVGIIFENGEFVVKTLNQAEETTRKIQLGTQAMNKEFAKTPKDLKTQVSLLRQALNNTKKYGEDGKKVTNEWKKNKEALNAAEAALKKLTGEAKKYSGEAGKGGKKTEQSLFKANIAARAVEGGLKLIVGGIKNVIDTGSQMESLQIQLTAFTGGAEEAGVALAQFSEIAAGTPFDLSSIANAGKIMMAFGLETETAIEATEDLAIVATATGGDINNLARNLGQIAAQGQAYTRDLTQFAIQGIPIWSEMSKVTGKSVSELKKLATEGKISFEIVNSALKSLTAEGGKYAEIVKEYENTWSGQTAKLTANLQNLALTALNTAKEIAEAYGTELFAPFQKLNEIIADVAQNFPGMVAGAIGAFQDFLPLITTATTLMIGLFGPQILAAIGSFVKAVYVAVAAIYAKVKAQVALLATMGPKGWAILAGAAVATGVALWGVSKAMGGIKEGAEAAQKKLDDIKNKLEGVKGEAEDAGEGLGDVFDEEKSKKYEARITGINKTLNRMKFEAAEIKREYDKQVAAIKDKQSAAVEALKEEKDGIEEVRRLEKRRFEDAKRELKNKKDAAVEALEAEKAAAERVHAQRMDQLESQEMALRAQMAASTAYYNQRIAQEKAAAQAAINNLERQAQAAANAAAAAQRRIEKRKEAERERFEAEMESLNQSKAAAQEAYDLEKTRIDSLILKQNELAEAAVKSAEQAKASAEARFNAIEKGLQDTLALETTSFQQSQANIEAQITKQEQLAAKKLAGLTLAADKEKFLNAEILSNIEAKYNKEDLLLESKKISLEANRDAELAGIDRVISRIEARYDSEFAKLDLLKLKTNDAYDAEIAKLEELSPAEERLKEIKKEKLIQQANNVALSEEERLSAQAQLDDMKRQKAIAEVRAAQAKAEVEFEKKKEQLIIEQTAAIKEQQDLLNERTAFYERELIAIEANIAASQAGREAEIETEKLRYQARVANLEAESDIIEASLESQVRGLEEVANANKRNYEERVSQIEGEAEAQRQRYEDQIAQIDRVRETQQSLIDANIQGLQDEATEAKNNFDNYIDQINDLAEAEKTAHEDVIEQLDEQAERAQRRAEAIQRNIEKRIEKEKEAAEKKEEQLNRLANQERVSQERRLREIEEQKKKEDELLEDKVENLSEEEKALLKKYELDAEALRIVEEAKRRVAEDRIKAIEKEIEYVKKKAEAEIKVLKDAYEVWKELQDKRIAALEEEKEELKELLKITQDNATATGKMATQTGNLARNSFNAANGVRELAKAQNELNAALANQPQGSQGGAGRATGGPVSAGTTYTVNERGPEAFLSSSGAVSMINVPSYGQWTPPEKGAVIPASLTRRLKVPRTGSSLSELSQISPSNSGILSQYARKAGGSSARLVKQSKRPLSSKLTTSLKGSKAPFLKNASPDTRRGPAGLPGSKAGSNNFNLEASLSDLSVALERGSSVPAYLRNQIEIPNGQVALSSINSMPNGLVSNVSNVSNVVSGDNISNTVTIQSQNPTQTANNMLVQLQKIKRGRTGR